MRFGNPVTAAWDAMQQGLAHPRAAAYEAGLRALRRTAHAHAVRAYHDGQCASLAQAREVFARRPGAALGEQLASLRAARGEPPLKQLARAPPAAPAAKPVSKRARDAEAPPSRVELAVLAAKHAAHAHVAAPLRPAKPPAKPEAPPLDAAATAAAVAGIPHLLPHLRAALLAGPSQASLATPAAPPVAPGSGLSPAALVLGLRRASEAARMGQKANAVAACAAAVAFLSLRPEADGWGGGPLVSVDAAGNAKWAGPDAGWWAGTQTCPYGAEADALAGLEAALSAHCEAEARKGGAGGV